MRIEWKRGLLRSCLLIVQIVQKVPGRSACSRLEHLGKVQGRKSGMERVTEFSKWNSLLRSNMGVRRLPS